MTTTTQYAKACNKCDQPILMKQSGGKWAAFEADGLNTHACQTSKPSTLPTGPPQEKTDQLTQILNSKDFEAKVRLLVKDEMERLLKKLWMSP